MTNPFPSRRTVSDVAAPYANFLVRVPNSGDDVCPICRSTLPAGFRRCYQCSQALKALGPGVADVTAFVSIAPRDAQFARELYSYKSDRTRDVDRRRMTAGLAAVLWKWLGLHEPCMAWALGIDEFDIITSVPSTSGRTRHPLPALISQLVAGSGARYQTLLTVHRSDVGQREHSPDRYRAVRDVRGSNILVIDDTWTTGAHAQSASAALKNAAAAHVGVLALGRWFNRGYGDGTTWLNKHRRPGWDWNRCCLDPSES